jgi:flagellin-like hook-associated protein FlgL
MRINTNTLAAGPVRSLDPPDGEPAGLLEQPSPGNPVNRKAAVASRPQFGESLDAPVSGVVQAIKSAQDGIAVVQTADDALTQISAMLERIRGVVRGAVSPAAAAPLVDTAIASVSELRGRLEVDENRFRCTIANLQVSTENRTAAESRVCDIRTAAELVGFTRDQILLQAGTAVLAQANAAPHEILRLLQ